MEELINDKDEELGPEDLEAGQAAAAYRCGPRAGRGAGRAPGGLCAAGRPDRCRPRLRLPRCQLLRLLRAFAWQRCLWDERAAGLGSADAAPPLPLAPPRRARAVNRQADDRTEEELAKYIEERYKWVAMHRVRARARSVSGRSLAPRPGASWGAALADLGREEPHGCRERGACAQRASW